MKSRLKYENAGGMTLPDAFPRLKEAVDSAAARKFPHGIPDPVRARIDRELDLAESSGLASGILALKAVADTCRTYGEEFLIAGTAGNAYLCYLLDITPADPLSPYVDRPGCGAYCKHAGGHDLPEEFFYSTYHGSFELRVTEAIRPMIYARLQKLFGPRRIAWVESEDRYLWGTFIFIPEGKTPEDFGETAVREPGHIITCRTDYISAGLDYINLCLHTHSELLTRLYRLSEKDYRDLPADDPEVMENCGPDGMFQQNLRNGSAITGCICPEKTSDLLAVLGLSRGLGNWSDYTRNLIDSGTPLDDIIWSRESVMRYLLRLGAGREDAFRLAEAVRKGLLNSCQERFRPLLDRYDIPEEYREQMRRTRYLLTESYLYPMLLQRVRIIKYRLNDPAAYKQAVMDVVPPEEFAEKYPG